MSYPWPPVIIDKLPVLEGEVFAEPSVSGALYTQQDLSGSLYSRQTLSGELYLPFVVSTGLLVDSDGNHIVDSNGNRIILYEVII